MKNKTRILFFDIETMANLAFVWGKYEQNVIDYDREWYMLCFAYKWLGEGKTQACSLPDFKGYKRDRFNDKALCYELWKLVDEADIVVAHNGQSFDVKMMNARFAFHGFKPPSPYKIVDTKLVAKRYFRFNSNKLDDLGNYFNLGRKIDTGGFELWLGCLNDDPLSWYRMVKYNKQDVMLLEKVYVKLLPWMTAHPNRNMTEGTQFNCPNCSSSNLQRRGYAVTRSSRYQRYQCLDCGCWSQGTREKTSGTVIS